MMLGKTTNNRGGVTWRSILLGLLLIPINVLWITIVEVRWYTLDGTCLPLFITPIFLLALLVAANMFVAKRSPEKALNQGELLTTYIMVVMSTAMASHDLYQNLFGVIGHPYRFATPQNGWQQLFIKYLPKWLLVTDPIALDGLYKGGVSPFHKEIIVHWIVPLAAWTAFLFTLVGMMLCINIILRKQWTQNERLVFPLVQLPLAMTDEGGKTTFFNNRLMWAGFAVAFLIGAANGAHYLYPAYPEIRGIKMMDIGVNFTTPPWNILASPPNTRITLYPFAVGLAFFIPLDLSFSCWFFFVARQLFRVLGQAQGWNTGQNVGFPYFDEQAAGAWIALGALAVFGARRYLLDVGRVMLGREGTGEAQQSDVLAYRIAAIGIAVGCILLSGFSYIIGLSAWVGVMFFGLYFVISIAITRVRAELGTPHEILFVNPTRIMLSAVGFEAIGAANLSIMSLMLWFNRGYRSHPMANQLEAFKMGEVAGVGRNRLVIAIVLATIVGALTAIWANLHITYAAGGMAKCFGFKEWVGRQAFQWQLQNWINTPEAQVTGNLGKVLGKWMTVRLQYIIAGALIVAGLRGLRGAFVWWPFHPAGYALAASYAMDYFWFPFFVGWLIKWLIIRYGGMRLHNTAVPFFLGLILGDFFVGSLWAILGPMLGMQTYKIFL